MSRMPERTWTLEDHLCRGCGGRILKCKTGTGLTTGGNPIYKCADCGQEKASSSASALCWCGFGHRNNTHNTAYRCAAFSILKERPELEDGFRECGCDPARGEVGIMLESRFMRGGP